MLFNDVDRIGDDIAFDALHLHVIRTERSEHAMTDRMLGVEQRIERLVFAHELLDRFVVFHHAHVHGVGGDEATSEVRPEAAR